MAQYEEVTDPKILAQLGSPSDYEEVTDPEILKQLGDPTGKESPSGLLQKALGTTPGALLGGAAQGLEHTIASMLNLPLKRGTEFIAKEAGALTGLPIEQAVKETGETPQIPYLDLYGDVPDTFGKKAAFRVGEFGAPLITGVGSIGGALTKGATIGESALAGGLAGYLGGGREGEGDEASRALSGAFGSIVMPATQLGSRAIAKKIVSKEAELSTKFKNDYQKIFDSLKDTSLAQRDLRVPAPLKTDAGKALSERLSANTKDSLRKFESNPSFENAHWLQSNLGKFVRELRGKRSLKQPEQEALNFAEDLQKRTHGSMSDFLMKNQKADVLSKYVDTTKDYAKEMVRFKKESIRAFKDKGKPRELIKSLQKERVMERGVPTEIPKREFTDIPGFEARRKIDVLADPLRKVVPYALAGGAAYEAGVPGAGTLAEILKEIKRG